MKLLFKNKIFSFLLLFSFFIFFFFFFQAYLHSQERNIIVLTYDLHGKAQGDLAYHVLNKHFKIPKKLIRKIQTKKPCQKIEDSIFHLCIDENKELQILGGRPDIFTAHFKIFLEN